MAIVKPPILGPARHGHHRRQQIQLAAWLLRRADMAHGNRITPGHATAPPPRALLLRHTGQSRCRRAFLEHNTAHFSQSAVGIRELPKRRTFFPAFLDQSDRIQPFFRDFRFLPLLLARRCCHACAFRYFLHAAGALMRRWAVA